MKFLDYINTTDYANLEIFIATLSILWYLFVILRLSYIILSFNKISSFVDLSKIYKKKIQEYFRILTMLILLLKFICGYDFFFYCFCLITVISLDFFIKTFRKISKRTVILSAFTGKIHIDSESNKVTVIPDENTRVLSEIHSSEYKIEINLTNEQIQEIINNFGTEMVDNVISGNSAVTIIERYLQPVIESSGMASIIKDITDHF